MVDGRKIRFARFLWWRTDTDKDGISGANGFADIRGIRNLAGLPRGRQNLAQVLLVDRHAASIELRNAVGVYVRAHHFVASLRQARSSNESYVSTTND